MDILTNYFLPFLGILLGLVVLHEAGHYVTAKLFGVKVLEAGIGIPPRIWGFRWRGTDYTLNAIPMGAFVRMLGEEDPTDPQSLAAQPKWKRTIIIGAGAFLNLVLAIALFSTGLMLPHKLSDGGALISGVVPDSPAARAGLQKGDEILKVNGREVRSAQEASYLVRLSQGSKVNFEVERPNPRTGSEIVKIEQVYARWDPPDRVDECGIVRSSGMTGIELGPARAFNVTRTPEERAELEASARKAYASYVQEVAPGSPAACYSPADQTGDDGLLRSGFGFVGLSATACSALDPEDRAEALALKRDLFPLAPGDCYQFSPPPAVEVPTITVTEPPWEAIPHGVRLAFESIILTRNQIWKLVRGFDSAPLTGPVGIAQATGEVVEVAGWRYLIEFAGSISMGLAILNFLPIPMVDGGRLAFIFVEFLRRGKRIAPEKEALIHLTGLVLMLMAFVVISYFDIARVIRGDSLLQ